MYDGSQIALALNGEGQVTNRYLWGPAVDMLLADERANAAAGENAVRWALGDHLNSVRNLAVWDEALQQTVLANQRQWSAFGELASETNPSAAAGTPPVETSLFGFTGLPFDTRTGLQHNRARWLDPSTHTFLSPDPIADDPHNSYRYAGNSPTILVDPTGLIANHFGNPDIPRSRLKAINDWFFGFFVDPNPDPQDQLPIEAEMWAAAKAIASPLGAVAPGMVARNSRAEVREILTVDRNLAAEGRTDWDRLQLLVRFDQANRHGVRQVDDYFWQHDAGDGHVQSEMEQNSDLVFGSIVLGLSGYGYGKSAVGFVRPSLLSGAAGREFAAAANGANTSFRGGQLGRWQQIGGSLTGGKQIAREATSTLDDGFRNSSSPLRLRDTIIGNKPASTAGEILPVTYYGAFGRGVAPSRTVRDNAADGVAREARVHGKLSEYFTEGSVQRELYLRTADGKRAIDPLTGEARRIDHAVIENDQVRYLVETTSKTADKTAQLAKEARIRANGGTFIRDKVTGELIDVSNVPTRVTRRK